MQIDMPMSGLDSLANDYLRFTMHFFQPIQQSARHIYHSAVPLSPKSSIFPSMSLPEQTRVSDFHGRSDHWGSVVRTITSISGSFTCVTTIGRGSTAKIAAASDDGTVRIYDSVTGVLRLSLRPKQPTLEMKGLLDGSLLVCLHKSRHLITLWDIQTGGLVHTFALSSGAKRIAVSLNGRYLASESRERGVDVWETACRTKYPPTKQFSGWGPCWMAPEELIMVVRWKSMYILDLATGRLPVHEFSISGSVHSAVYSQVFDRLVIMCSDPHGGNSFTIHDTKTGTSSTLHSGGEPLTSIAFSQTTKQLVCGKARGLETVDISTGRRTPFDFPATVTSISTLSNGTVVANVPGSGIQLLSLEQGHAPPRKPTPPALTVYPLDRGRIIATFLKTDDFVILLETATMSQVLSIPTRKILSVTADNTLTLDASLEHKIAAHYVAEGDKGYLQVSELPHLRPRWTLPAKELPSAVKLSPACTRLVTFHNGRSRSSVRVWDAYDGRQLAWMSIDNPHAPRPLDITFDSEDRFYLYDSIHREPHVIKTAFQTGNSNTHFITRCAKERLDEHVLGKHYSLDDGHEWVVCGSRRICWVPQGYIGSAPASHCWAGSSLVMVGRDEILRKLTFLESLL